MNDWLLIGACVCVMFIIWGLVIISDDVEPWQDEDERD